MIGPPESQTHPGDSPELAAHTAIEAIDLGPLDQLVPIVFDELRAVARRQLSRHERYTLQTTDLVHEAYLRLVGDSDVTRRGKPYFYAAAARAMRCVLVDAARRRNAIKRGSGAAALSLEGNQIAIDPYADELLDLDAAIRDLESWNSRAARVIECRFFGGMSVEDTAEVLDVSPRTVKSDWALARAWLYDSLHGAT